MYEIEKGIEIPPQKARGFRTKYPFKTMEIGDSFFEPCAEEDIRARSNSIYASARRLGMKAAIRPGTNGKKVGLRIWRVAPKE